MDTNKPVDLPKEIPTLFKIMTGHYTLLKGLEPATLTETEKEIMLEQLVKWMELQGLKFEELAPKDQEATAKIFFTGYLCGALFGAEGVRGIYKLNKDNN